MTVEEIKQEINKKTGIPVYLLTGETIEENIARAKAILAYRKEQAEQYEAERPKTTSEQFADWMQAQSGEERTEQPDAETQALLDLEESLQVVPNIMDNGNAYAQKEMPDGRTTAEQFGAWMSKQFAFNPYKNN